MKFAFLIHYLSGETRSLMQLDRGGALRTHWGLDVLEFCSSVHQTMEALHREEGADHEPAISSSTADRATGRTTRRVMMRLRNGRRDGAGRVAPARRGV